MFSSDPREGLLLSAGETRNLPQDTRMVEQPVGRGREGGGGRVQMGGKGCVAPKLIVLSWCIYPTSWLIGLGSISSSRNLKGASTSGPSILISPLITLH